MKRHEKLCQKIMPPTATLFMNPPARVWRGTWLDTSQGPSFTSVVDTLSWGKVTYET